MNHTVIITLAIAALLVLNVPGISGYIVFCLFCILLPGLLLKKIAESGIDRPW